MIRRHHAFAVATAFIGSMLFSIPSALARDPAPGGTGVDLSSGATVTDAQMGLTPAAKVSKLAGLQAFQSKVQTLGMSAATASAAGLGGWVNYHQKTNYNCVDAIGQSILHRSFDTATSHHWIDPSVAARQGNANQGAGTIALGMHTTTGGTDERNAFAYINGVYAANGSDWRYMANVPDRTTLTDFTALAVYEIGQAGMPLYVRINLTSPHYAWHQTTFATHATAVSAYGSSGSTVTIADPFTHTNSSGTCVPSPYTATPDVSCSWANYSTSEYYKAKDIVRQMNGPLYPIYW